MLKELEEKLTKTFEPLNKVRHDTIPKKSMTNEQTLSFLKEMRGGEVAYRECKAIGGIYEDDQHHFDLLNQVYALYSDSNALYPMIFPALRKMECEILRMTANLLHGDSNVVGSLNSGGSESIMVAMKGYRDRSLKMYGITKPEVLICDSTHPAFVKAGHYLNINVIRIPMDKDLRMDMNIMKSKVTKNTICIVASAPTFPHGVIDPIEEIAAFCSKNNIGMHVDSCVGGFLIPWLQKIGEIKKKIDFEAPGVTSITADLHKYGMSSKGAAVLLWKNSEYRKYQYSSDSEWSGGVYASPSVQGSRGGGAIASAYSTLISLGEEGYLNAARFMTKNFHEIVQGISEIKELRFLGTPECASIAFTSDHFNIYQVQDAMNKLGKWELNRVQKPIGIMIQIIYRTSFSVSQFLSDLRKAVEIVKVSPPTDGEAAFYGLAAKLPARGVVADLALGYLDVLYK